ncbi:HAD-IA family hydrolase [bacterium]|nr:HAD-IA family hydrolase [bacterium]
MNRPAPRGYLIDIEGVLVRNKAYEPVAGSVEWMERLAAAGAPFCLVSNNTTDRPGTLIDRLNRAGFSLTRGHLLGAVELALTLLMERGIGRIVWLGAPGMRGYWEEAGIEVVGGGPCGAVVMGLDPGLDVARLDAVLPSLLDHGADLICLHRNLFYLDADDRRRLGPGCWSAALEALGGRGKVVTVGKPDPRIYRAAMKRIGVAAADTLFISDDPVADLVTAGRLGMQTAFVLSGKYGDHEILGRMDQEDWPGIICSRLADLPLPEKEPE